MNQANRHRDRAGWLLGGGHGAAHEVLARSFIVTKAAMNADRTPIMQAAYVERLGAADEMPVARSAPGSPGTSPVSFAAEVHARLGTDHVHGRVMVRP
jgi:hypothetical protein